MTGPARQTMAVTRARLWAELVSLYVGVPIAMAVWFGQYSLFGVIFVLALVAAGLLSITPGFQWRDLLKGPVLGDWRLILGFFVLAFPACLGVAYVLVPERMFEIVEHRPALWAFIMLAYPIASAAPQELIFRPLFFHRYAGLFPTESVAIIANALLFGFAHLFYMNPVTIGLTTLVGVIFALGYLRHRSFLMAVVLHGLAGQIVFTVGLGIFFYHGAVPG